MRLRAVAQCLGVHPGGQGDAAGADLLLPAPGRPVQGFAERVVAQILASAQAAVADQQLRCGTAQRLQGGAGRRGQLQHVPQGAAAGVLADVDERVARVPAPSAPGLVRVDLVHGRVPAVRVRPPGGQAIFLSIDRLHASCTISSTAAAPISAGVAKSRVLPSKPIVSSAYAVMG